MYSIQDIYDYIEAEDVRFIRLAFFDPFGVQHNVSILPQRLPRAFEKGIAIDASALDGFETEQWSDLFVKPDPSTMTRLPWRSSDGSVIQMICDLYLPDGSLYESIGRQMLKKAAAKYARRGLDLEIAAKFEFTLFWLDEKGRPTEEPLDQGGYMDVAPSDGGENIRREICLTLQEMGLQPQKSYHQEGPGQNEIDFHFAPALKAADEASLFKWVVRTAASANGLYADFSPKPQKRYLGNGFHIQIRFFEEDEQIQAWFMAGILAHLPELTLFFNPASESYSRLGRDKAPMKADWSSTTRFVSLRIPPRNPGIMELRSPDCLSSPSLAFALVMEAGLDGIERQLELPEPNDPDAASLPDSLDYARRLASRSEFVRRIVPKALLDAYLKD